MKKLGLCLSGGGARGAYQIGALTALQELGIYEKVEVITGTSIGSVNAAIVGSNSIKAAKDFWMDLEENPLQRKMNFFEQLKEEKLKAVQSGIYSIEALNHIIETGIDFEKIKDMDIIITVTESGEYEKGLQDFVRSSFDHYIHHNSKAVYLNLRELEREMIIESVKASCSIPVVFPPVEYEGKQYYDGGVVDNAPLQPLIDAGCDEIILINISALNSMFEIKKKSAGITLHKIQSRRYLGSVLDFTTKHSEKLFKWGYDDTMKYFAKEKKAVLA